MLRFRSPIITYSVAVLSVAACTILREPMTQVMGMRAVAPFAAIYPAVLLSSYLGGLGPGLVAMALGAASGLYFFVGAAPPDEIAHSRIALRLIAYISICVFTSVVTEAARRAKAAERRHRDWLEVTLTSIGDAVIAADTEARVTFVNPVAQALIGWSQDEAVGQHLNTVFDVVSEDTGEKVENLAELIMHPRPRPGVALGNDTILISKDGRRVPIDDSGAPIRDARGAIAGVIIVFHDVSERRQAEEALRRSEARFAGILNIADDAVISIDESQKITLFSDGAKRIFGYDRHEVLGQPVSMLLPERYREPHKVHVDSFVQSTDISRRMANRREIMGLRNDGTEFFAEASISKLDMEGEKVLTVMLRDITERRRTEEALRQSEEQFRQSQKMEAVGRLAGGIAHDFNNLLTAILGFSELAKMGTKPGDPVAANLDEIAKAAQRAAALTKQLLAFSRKQVLDPRVLDLSEQVRDIEELLRRVMGDDVELITVLGSNLGRVRVDPNQIQQVILNLVVNARDAMPYGGTVTIETAGIDVDETYAVGPPGPQVMLAISDTGKGMDEETREHIFEPFFTTKEMGKGTGLGLSTVYGIIKQSNGNISVHSEPASGTTFKIYLPVVHQKAGKGERAQTSSGASEGQETILVVEDQEKVLKLVREILEQRGYFVLHASRPLDAVAICRQHEGDINLLITDLVMPQMSGRQLAERVTAIRPAMRVLYMSGYSDNMMVSQGILGSGAAFIQKPFQISALMQKIDEVLGTTKDDR
jgi:two-component system cell cycle sensor histidine kinase/response regulator CckA